MDNNVNISPELMQKGRTLALKIIAESYLKVQGKETDELFKDLVITEETKLSGHEAQVLHYWLADEYKAAGLDLNKVIEIHGEVADGTKLTNYEIDELVRRADYLSLQIGILKKYLDANHK